METLHTCPTCQTNGFTVLGLAAHKRKCKGVNRNAIPLPPSKLKHQPSSVSVEVVRPREAVLADASKALEKLRTVIVKHEESFHAQTLGPRLQIGLQCLKAHQIFSIPDPKKSGAMKGKKALTRERLSIGSFKDWLTTEAQWLKEPTAYKYMTAVRGLGLDHDATEKQVAAALKLLLRKGPVSIKSLCDSAVDAIGPDSEQNQNNTLQQTEFEFLRKGLVDFRTQADALLALKSQLHENPDMERVASARVYSLLHELTGTHWKPSDEPDELASVDPDAITL